ncbi:DUF2989 domain-containing protein [Shewanella acanthi]|uniref:DUF2989 domain-containing protein n=1 Tax=Shewanella acanthi TaxID=2864212 RepID=UPI001C65FD5A|nr:DUF2989 domain-containing protein [Shewanella acanthi]QYJ80596.1 DUF2989 domain-containing protein [Shewanella acanthi]
MRYNLVIITSFSVGLCFFALFGCDRAPNAEVICKNNPEICSDLNKDGWCQGEKNNLILHRFEIKDLKHPTGKQVYQQLTYLEDYSKCIEVASGVQQIVHTHRTADRARAYTLSTENLNQLQAESKEYQDPFMSYYQWTRFNDTSALNRLLKQEEAGEVTDPFLLGQIATYYSSRNSLKSQHLYLRVLSEIQYDDFDPSWLLGLAASFKQNQVFDKTYMLTKANILLTQQKYSQDKMLALISGNKTMAKSLDAYAQDLVDTLRKGSYANSEVRAWLERSVSDLVVSPIKEENSTNTPD